jgi:hypothetical protein
MGSNCQFVRSHHDVRLFPSGRECLALIHGEQAWRSSACEFGIAKEGRGKEATDAGAEEARTFDARITAPCRRARPTAVESHWGARDSWSGCGRNMGVCQPRSFRVALIYVLVQGLTVRPRLG